MEIFLALGGGVPWLSGATLFCKCQSGEADLISHLYFILNFCLHPSFPHNPDTGLHDSCTKLTWKTIIFYNSSKQGKMVAWFLSCPDCLITGVSRNGCIVIKLQSIQVPGDLLTCTQHWQSAARVRCAWWWWHHHFWQLSPTSVEWGNVPKIKTDSRINNDRFLEPSLCALNWSSISSIRACQKIIMTLQHTTSKGHQHWLLQEGLVTPGHCLTLFSTGDGQVSQHLSSCHPHPCQHSALGVQLELTLRDVAVSSWGRVQPEEGSVSCCSPLRNLQGHAKTHQLPHKALPSTFMGIF